MLSEHTAEAIVTYGFPLFWIGVGIVQWFWPSAIFVAFSDDQVTPGARGVAVCWLVLGSGLASVFVPWLHHFGGWFVPGFVLLVVGGLQFARPAWSIPVGDRSGDATAMLLAASGTAVLLFGLI